MPLQSNIDVVLKIITIAELFIRNDNSDRLVKVNQ